jgi:hypothetical protein
MTYQVGDEAPNSFPTPPLVAMNPPAPSAPYLFQLTATDIPVSNTYQVTICAWDQNGSVSFPFNVQALNINASQPNPPNPPPSPLGGNT